MGWGRHTGSWIDVVSCAYNLGWRDPRWASRRLEGMGTGRAQAAQTGGLAGMSGLGGDGEPGGAGVFEGGDVVDVAEGQADVVEAFH